MKIFFYLSLLGLIFLSLIALLIKPQTSNHGKIPIIWAADDNPARRDQVNIFNKNYTEYELLIDPSNSDMAKVIVQSLAGVGPDLFTCYDGFSLSGYIKAGIAWDITDKLPGLGIDIDNDVWNGALPTCMLNGRVYGFVNNVAVDAIWYNKDIFDEYNIPYPKGSWNWEEFISLAQKLTIKDENGKIKLFGFLSNWNCWQDIVMQWGGSFYSKDGTICTIDSPESIAAIQFIHDLIYKYRVAPNPQEEAAMATQGGWGTGTITFFGGGKGAMAIGGRWWLCILRSYKDLRLGAVETPHGSKKVYFAYGRSTLVNKHSPRREDALKFIKYMSEKPYNDLVNAQADALSPMKKYCYTDEYLYNPDYPEEDYNTVWRDVAEYGVGERISPFVNGYVASRAFNRQFDLVKANQKSAAEAMKDVAKEINYEIKKNLEKDPSLKELYIKLTQKDGKDN